MVVSDADTGDGDVESAEIELQNLMQIISTRQQVKYWV